MMCASEWLLDTTEVASAFDLLAGAHDEFLTSQPPTPSNIVVQHIIENHLPIKTESAVLDVGCGNGIWSKFIAGFGYPVTMVDSSSEMLRYATKNLDTAGLSARVKTYSADAHDLTFLPSDTFPWFSP